jgi:hypothetical protein
MRSLRAVALRPPYAYVLNWAGDLWVFKLPDAGEDKSGQEVQEVGHVPNAGDGYALAVIGDTLLCTRSGSLEAFSLADPARSLPLGRFGFRAFQALALVRDQDRLIVSGTDCLSVFDVSRPARPRRLGTTQLGATQAPRFFGSGCVVGGRLYAAE